MSIINFLKKILKTKQEKITFSQAKAWVKKKEEDIKGKEKKIAKSIKENLSLFIVNLNKNLPFLENINLDKFKEEINVKHIVLSNLKEYISLVENLLVELGDFKSLNLFELNNLIDKSFLDFNKKSHTKYEKSTYLIGKELRNVDQPIQNFLKSYSKIIKANEDVINAPKIIKICNQKLDDYNNNLKEIKKLNSNIREFKKEIKDSKQKIKDYFSEIKKIETSELYIRNLNNIQRVKDFQLELRNDMASLRQLIDFKVLANIFHGSERYRNIVKNFRGNFNESFKADNGKTLLGLLEESKLNNASVLDKFKIINDKSKELKTIKSKIKDDGIQILKDKIKQLEFQIENLNDEINRKLKRNRKIDDSQEIIKKFLKEEFLKMNVEFEE